MTKIIDGKTISNLIKSEVEIEVKALLKQGVIPGLTVMIVGEDQASQTYVASKETSAKAVGMNSTVIRLPSSTLEVDVLSQIEALNHDQKVHGILVQLPLPKQISEEKVINAIDPRKDVDGFHPINVGGLVSGNKDAFVPCTPAGVMVLLERENIQLEGKHVVIIGRSHMVGKPLIPMFLQKNATVTICHSKTNDLAFETKQADILVVAIGRDRLVNADHVKPGAVVIDVGINRVDGKLYGDVDFSSVAPVASKITPVPGGVGPMTIAMLLKNTVKAAKLQNNL
jgi:methylenetetrahydrofolate dehydrogenase (NADP+)/methenyltetrahydrofolate cyclohydrolase